MIRFFFVLWGFSALLQAEERKLTVDNINQARQVLNDPTQTVNKALAHAPLLSANDGKVVKKKPLPQLNDPTRLTGTFREALRKIRSGSGASDGGQQIPDITLAGKTYSEDGKKSSALLKIKERLYFVKPGTRFSINYNQQLYDIKVNEIDLQGVQITIFPANEVLILR